MAGMEPSQPATSSTVMSPAKPVAPRPDIRPSVAGVRACVCARECKCMRLRACMSGYVHLDTSCHRRRFHSPLFPPAPSATTSPRHPAGTAATQDSDGASGNTARACRPVAAHRAQACPAAGGEQPGRRVAHRARSVSVCVCVCVLRAGEERESKKKHEGGCVCMCATQLVPCSRPSSNVTYLSESSPAQLGDGLDCAFLLCHPFIPVSLACALSLSPLDALSPPVPALFQPQSSQSLALFAASQLAASESTLSDARDDPSATPKLAQASSMAGGGTAEGSEDDAVPAEAAVLGADGDRAPPSPLPPPPVSL